ncbi:MAG TPA: TolC family protein [Anaeromyxobacter sp.]|nr:TolC family protein [Anaeromyxobacter sp.]
MNVLTSVAVALLFAQAPTESPPAAAPPALAAPVPAPEPAVPASAPPAGPVVTLRQALEVAATQSLDLQALEARLRQSNELSWKAWSAYLPQVTVSGSYTRNEYSSEIPWPAYQAVRARNGNPGGNPTDPPGLPGDPSPYFVATAYQNVVLQKVDQLGAQAQITQLLVSPQLWYQIGAAKSGEKASALSIENGRREILFGVARAYYGVASLKQALIVSERLLEIAQRQEKDARVRYQAGAVAKVALIRAEIDRARAEQDVKRALNSYLSGKVALAVLLARDTNFEVTDPPEPPLPADLTTLEEQSVRRPDVLAAWALADTARSTRNSAIARYFPDIGAFANYTFSNIGGFTGNADFWTVGIQAQWKIFDGGLRESDIREGNARMDEAQANARNAELHARADVRQALLDLESARANAQKAKEQRDLSAENQRLVDVSFKAGTATAVEQADATTQLRNAEIALLTESLNAQLAAVQLLKVSGTFDPVPSRR